MMKKLVVLLALLATVSSLEADVRRPPLTRERADTLYCKLTGCTMTGSIGLANGVTLSSPANEAFQVTDGSKAIRHDLSGLTAARTVVWQDIGGTIYVSGGTDVAVADGGTGASDAATARTNLGLVIGTHVQAWDAELDTWATKTPYAGALTITAGKTANVTNTLTLAGTDGTTLTFQGTGTVVNRESTDTLSNKTLTAPQMTTVNVTDGALSLNSAQLQAFAFTITNTAGTLQHSISGEIGTGTASAYAGRITGASATLANTPSVNGATGFTSGAGINASATQQIIFDTGVQTNSKFLAICVVESNTTATAGIMCTPRTLSSDVNGTTRNRLILTFNTVAGGFALTTANIASGTLIRARVIAVVE